MQSKQEYGHALASESVWVVTIKSKYKLLWFSDVLYFQYFLSRSMLIGTQNHNNDVDCRFFFIKAQMTINSNIH